MLETHDLSKSEVLRALYNASEVQGMGFMQAVPGDLTEEKALELLAKQTYFDYLFGKIMKVNLASLNNIDPTLYDRDNGLGAAQQAIDDFCLAKWEEREER